MFVSLQHPKSYMEALTPDVTAEVGPLGGDEVMTVGPTWMGLVPFYKRDPREDSKTLGVCAPERDSHLTVLISDVSLQL